MDIIAFILITFVVVALTYFYNLKQKQIALRDKFEASELSYLRDQHRAEKLNDMATMDITTTHPWKKNLLEQKQEEAKAIIRVNPSLCDILVNGKLSQQNQDPHE